MSVAPAPSRWSCTPSSPTAFPELSVPWHGRDRAGSGAAGAQRAAGRRPRPGRRRSCGHRRGPAADRQRRTRRRDAGRPGLRRSPVRRLLTAARRRPGAVAGRDRRPRREPARPAPQGLRPDAVLPGRRRPRRGRPDAAGVPRQRGHARARRPDHPVAGRGRHRPAGAARDRPARCCSRPGRGQPPAGRQLPVRPRHRRRRPAPAARRRGDPSSSSGGGGRRRTPTWPCSTRSSTHRRRWSPGGCWSASCTA